MIGGDFNCTLSEQDKKGGNPSNRKHTIVEEINKLCNLYDLDDIWRSLNPDTEEFTWRNKSFKIQCRLDFFPISKKLNDLTNKCKIVYAPKTDHSATLIYLKSNEMRQKKGPGFWKFNQSLLIDKTYVSSLRAEIPNFRQKYNAVEDLTLKWDLIKMEIRSFTIKYSKNKTKKTNLQKFTSKIKSTNFTKKLKNNPITSKLLTISITLDPA